MDSSIASTEGRAQTAVRRRGLWRWFAVGFVAVFLGLLVFYPAYAVHSSGQYVEQKRLWKLYADVAGRLFKPSPLGPANDNSSVLVVAATEHLVLSAAGGAVVAGVGWWRRRRVA